MAEEKNILVVDDYFEMLSFLRSILELSDQSYRVTGVPSAEEGMLELQQNAYDLLITDLRLPGISGFDLVRQARRRRPRMPVIMITAYSSDEGRQEATDLGVFRYFRKPLDTDGLLAAVHEALRTRPEAGHGRGATVPVADSVGHVESESPMGTLTDIARRLTMLRADTSATQVALARLDGTLLHDTGGQWSEKMPALTQTIARNMKSSYDLAQQLESHEPFTIQYQAGQRVDVYSANVGADHFVTILIDAQTRRGRIGTVWVFAQRAVADLLNLLPASASASAPPPAPPSSEPTRLTVEAVAALPAAEPSPPPAAPIAESDYQAIEIVATPPVEEPTPSPPPSVAATPPPVEPAPLPLADLAAAMGPGIQVEEIDLDAFWEQASEMEERSGMRGISWEEAREQGLIGRIMDER